MIIYRIIIMEMINDLAKLTNILHLFNNNNPMLKHLDVDMTSHNKFLRVVALGHAADQHKNAH